MSGRIAVMAVVALATAGRRLVASPGGSPCACSDGSVEGGVALRALDGGVLVPGKWPCRFTREMMEDHLRAWLKPFEQAKAENEMSIESARQVWRERNAARLEAARVVKWPRNPMRPISDRAACCAKPRRLRRNPAPPRTIVRGWRAHGGPGFNPGACPGQDAGPCRSRGNFALELQPGIAWCLFLPPAEKDRAVWLHSLDVPDGGKAHPTLPARSSPSITSRRCSPRSEPTCCPCAGPPQGGGAPPCVRRYSVTRIRRGFLS